jgi:hypothetical protein
MFDFLRGHEPEDDVYQVCLKPLKGYIDSKNFNEAYLALQNILVECIFNNSPISSSNSTHIIEDEAELLGWNGSSLYSILNDVKELGDRIDIEKNVKCGAYAACKLYNEVYSQDIDLLYERYAKKHSMT